MPASKSAQALRSAPVAATLALRPGAAPGRGLPADLTDLPDPADPAVLADPMSEEPLVHHPDGWYWLSPDGHERFGPFATQAEALVDLHAAELDELAPDELLSEAEAEIGMADWIDPDTGEPAEGQGVPHLPAD